jgi:hypothetical protein
MKSQSNLLKRVFEKEMGQFEDKIKDSEQLYDNLSLSRKLERASKRAFKLCGQSIPSLSSSNQFRKS